MDFVTIKKKVETEITEKKSKFIATMFPVQSIEETEELIRMVRKKYYTARHNCIAYRIVQDNQIIEKSSDDGEPSGTAGTPMLTILKKNNLANVLIVVTRYFGGILLGTGGLVRAYSSSLLNAIQESEMVNKCEGIEMMIYIEYSEFEHFKYYCKNNNIFITNVEYSDLIGCKIEMEDDKKEKLMIDFQTKAIILKDVKEINKKYIEKSI